MTTIKRPPDPYAAVIVAVEFMKCVGLCTKHHEERHKLENYDPQKVNENYNLTEDSEYVEMVIRFRESVIESISPELSKRINKGLNEILGERSRLRPLSALD